MEVIMNNKNTKSKETTTTKSRTVKKEVKTRSSNGAHLKTNLIAAIIILFGVLYD